MYVSSFRLRYIYLSTDPQKRQMAKKSAKAETKSEPKSAAISPESKELAEWASAVLEGVFYDRGEEAVDEVCSEILEENKESVAKINWANASPEEVLRDPAFRQSILEIIESVKERLTEGESEEEEDDDGEEEEEEEKEEEKEEK